MSKDTKPKEADWVPPRAGTVRNFSTILDHKKDVNYIVKVTDDEESKVTGESSEHGGESGLV